MPSPSGFKHKSAALFLLVCLLWGGAPDLTAEAKKKAAKVDPAAQAAADAEAKAKAAEAELQKGLTPLATDLTKLMMRIQGRGLLSPEEAGKLVEIKYKLLDLMEQYPQNPLLAKPVYQAGTLFSEREAYNDAFEMFQYLAQGYISNPYGAKAKGQIQMLERKFGANYFSVEMAAPVNPPDPTAGPGGIAASGTPKAPGVPVTPAATPPPAKK